MAPTPPERQFGATWAPEGLSGSDQASQEPVRASQGLSCAVRTTLGQYEYILVYAGNLFCFANISAPCNLTKLILYSKFTYGSQFSEEKNGVEIRSLVPEISNKQTFERFF